MEFSILSGSWDDIIKGLATGSLGLIGTLIGVGVTWVKGRSASTQRIRVLDEATKRILFWDAWLDSSTKANLAEELGKLESRIRGEMLAAAKMVGDTFESFQAEVPTDMERLIEYERFRASISRFRRWLLLYRPPRARAWIPRFFFYYIIVALPWLIYMGFSSGTATASDQAGAGASMSPLFSAVSFAIAGLASIVLYRALSVWAERPPYMRSGR